MKLALTTTESNIILETSSKDNFIRDPNYYYYSGVIPNPKEEVQTQIQTNDLLRLVLGTDGGIVVMQNRLMFQQLIESKSRQSIYIDSMTRKYLESMPNMEYQKMVTTFVGHVPFDERQPLAAVKYLTDTFVAPGPWVDFGTTPAQTGLTFLYNLESSRLTLNVNHGTLRKPDETIIPIVMFHAEFNYHIQADTQSQLLQNLIEVVDNWQLDLKMYQNLVNTRFLNTNIHKNSRKRVFLKAS